MKQEYVCDYCGKRFTREESRTKGKKHLFCSRMCLAAFSSKQKNPKKYADLKNYSNTSKHMSNLNKELNQSRMSPVVRKKIREFRLGKGTGKGYGKLYGKAEHRVVAESFLGRALKSDEVVHHLDFNKRNNEPWNLIIFPSQKEHARYHAALSKFFDTGELPNYKIEEVMPDDVQTT